MVSSLTRKISPIPPNRHYLGIRNIKKIIYATAVMGNFIALLDSTSVNIALYNMSKSFSLSLSRVQWVYTIYMLVLSVFLPFWGKLGDVFARNKIFATGFLTFALGAFLCFFSHNFTALLCFRSMEALGGSILLSNAMAIVTSIYKGKKRGEALGMIGAVCALAGMLGPAIAGILMQYFGWNAIFLPVAFTGILGAILSYKIIPKGKVLKNVKIDIIGTILMIICLTCFLLSITEGQNLGWINKKILFSFFVAVVSAILFYIREMSITFPIVDFKLFANKTILCGDLSLIFCYLAMTANTILFPFYTQHVLKYSAVLTAIAVLPYALANVIFAPVAGKLSGYIGSKFLTLLGGSLIGSGMLILMCFGAKALFISLITTQFIIGTGSAFFQSPANNAIMAKSSLENASTNSGIIALSRNIGMTVGVAIATTVFTIAHEKFSVPNSNPMDVFINSYHSSLGAAVIFAFTCAFLSFYAFKRSK